MINNSDYPITIQRKTLKVNKIQAANKIKLLKKKKKKEE